MLGYCPICNKQIFKITKGKLVRPLGNYRSIKLILKNKSTLSFPLCMHCEENFTIKSAEPLIRKLYQYEQPLKLTEEEYVNKFKDVVGFIKEGPLKQVDKERNQIWR